MKIIVAMMVAVGLFLGGCASSGKAPKRAYDNNTFVHDPWGRNGGG